MVMYAILRISPFNCPLEIQDIIILVIIIIIIIIISMMMINVIFIIISLALM